jgi:hypothetical protein
MHDKIMRRVCNELLGKQVIFRIANRQLDISAKITKSELGLFSVNTIYLTAAGYEPSFEIITSITLAKTSIKEDYVFKEVIGNPELTAIIILLMG